MNIHLKSVPIKLIKINLEKPKIKIGETFQIETADGKSHIGHSIRNSNGGIDFAVNNSTIFFDRVTLLHRIHKVP